MVSQIRLLVRAGGNCTAMNYSFPFVLPESARLLWTAFLILAALLLGLGCSSTSLAETKLSYFGIPALSPDGRMVAVPIRVQDHRSFKLALFNVDAGSLRMFEPPPGQTWHRPSFSPSGDRLTFVRTCLRGCKSERIGVHVGILDVNTGRNRVATTTVNLARVDPIFAPGGRFIVYATREVADINQWPLPRGILHRRLGFWTRDIHILHLDTGVETKVSFRDNWRAQFLRIRPVGFLDDKTLVIRAMSPVKGGTAGFTRKDVMQRVQGLQGITGGRPDHGDYLYTITFSRSFVDAEQAPRPSNLDLLETDWVRPVSHPFQDRSTGFMVSPDPGLMAFVDRSTRNRKQCSLGCTYEYDIFLANKESVRQATFLHTNMADATISWTGNRVAFRVLDENERYGQLWMLDVPSGKAWETGLKEAFMSLSPSSGLPQN